MSRPLRSPKLCDELGPRKIVFAPTFRRHKALNPRAEQDFLTLTNCVKKGVPLPDRFYRPRSGARDPLLEEYGVLHLHLEGQTSDTLIFLMQFTGEVLFLETNTHKRHQVRWPVDLEGHAGSLLTSSQPQATNNLSFSPGLRRAAAVAALKVVLLDEGIVPLMLRRHLPNRFKAHETIPLTHLKCQLS